MNKRNETKFFFSLPVADLISVSVALAPLDGLSS